MVTNITKLDPFAFKINSFVSTAILKDKKINMQKTSAKFLHFMFQNKPFWLKRLQITSTAKHLKTNHQFAVCMQTAFKCCMAALLQSKRFRSI